MTGVQTCALPILNAKNAAELLSKTNVDGGLIGGASLKAADFTTIINAAVNG